jgi:uncharacterized metal-binding protein
VKDAEKTIMIDGCFLTCHGRVVKNLIGEDKVIQIDAFPLYKKYSEIFSMEEVPEEERKAVARQVADKIIAMLREGKHVEQRTHVPPPPATGMLPSTLLDNLA